VKDKQYVTIELAAQALTEFEHMRIQQENRIRTLTSEPDIWTPDDAPCKKKLPNGKKCDSVTVHNHGGMGYPEAFVIDARQLLSTLKAGEKLAQSQLKQTMIELPYWDWIESTPGISWKGVGRLLGAIGDPSYNRTNPAQLWAYCGYAPGQKLQKGVQANWNSNAKMRAYLVSLSAMKTQGPYRELFLDRREHTAETHPEWTKGHSMNDALRYVSKRLLRDLWEQSRQS
jgi:hypothetical protein